MSLAVAGMELLILVEVVLVAMALTLSIIAALGFWNAPFGRLLKPLPIVLFAFLLMDGGNLIDVDLSIWYFHGLGAIASTAAGYAAIQGALLLTERREV